ncbi:MAG: hypothetical protein LKK00_02430 [Intestinimonas sp.]|jgi:hypothetical protein|nr:hypothetical protein [Intestinimonas sp.]
MSDKKDRKGIYSPNAALVPDGVMPPAQTNALNEVVSENVMRNPYNTLLMEAGILSPDRAASTPDVSSPDGSNVDLPLKRSRDMAPGNGDPAVARSRKKPSSSAQEHDPETEGRITP